MRLFLGKSCRFLSIKMSMIRLFSSHRYVPDKCLSPVYSDLRAVSPNLPMIVRCAQKNKSF